MVTITAVAPVGPPAGGNTGIVPPWLQFPVIPLPGPVIPDPDEPDAPVIPEPGPAA